LLKKSDYPARDDENWFAFLVGRKTDDGSGLSFLRSEVEQ